MRQKAFVQAHKDVQQPVRATKKLHIEHLVNFLEASQIDWEGAIDARQINIIKLLLGRNLNDDTLSCRPCSYQEIAEILNVSKERVRQLLEKTIRQFKRLMSEQAQKKREEVLDQRETLERLTKSLEYMKVSWETTISKRRLEAVKLLIRKDCFCTNGEIAKLFNITEERVSQIQAKTIRRLSFLIDQEIKLAKTFVNFWLIVSNKTYSSYAQELLRTINQIAFSNVNTDFISIRDLKLSTRTCNALYHNGIVTVTDIINRENELLSFTNLGQKSLEEVEDALESILVVKTSNY